MDIGDPLIGSPTGDCAKLRIGTSFLATESTGCSIFTAAGRQVVKLLYTRKHIQQCVSYLCSVEYFSKNMVMYAVESTGYIHISNNIHIFKDIYAV